MMGIKQAELLGLTVSDNCDKSFGGRVLRDGITIEGTDKIPCGIYTVVLGLWH